MLKKPREGKGIPTFAMKKLGPPPNTPPQPKRPRTHRQHQQQHQPESGVFSGFIICFQTDPYPLANPHSRLFTRRFYLIALSFDISLALPRLLTVFRSYLVIFIPVYLFRCQSQSHRPFFPSHKRISFCLFG